MTNFEYLVKKGRLVEFIDDLIDEEIGCGILRRRYGVFFDDDLVFTENVCNWLQAERPVEKYINIKEVISTLEEVREKFQGAAVVMAYIDEAQRALELCEFKEIDV